VTTLLAPERRPACGERVSGLHGGGATLEQRLETTLEQARAEGTAVCPVCAGALRRAHDGSACADCGSSLT
jgi:hypothetical protein